MTRALSGARAAASLARLSVKRLFRSRVVWISAILAVAPVAAQAAAGGSLSARDDWRDLYSVLMVILAIIPALHLAPALAEEIEDKTYTYLWSRPFPRWALLAGKLMALVPIAAAFVSASIALSFVLAFGGETGAFLGLLGDNLLAAALGVVAMSCTSLGIGSLVPRYATAASLVYLLTIDSTVGLIPFSIQNLSMSFHVRTIALADLSTWANPGSSVLVSIAWLLGIAALWIGVAVWRITGTEYAADK
jgi:ABC-type transport system involved in multi-copper enzyme maturation permease subunit